MGDDLNSLNEKIQPNAFGGPNIRMQYPDGTIHDVEVTSFYRARDKRDGSSVYIIEYYDHTLGQPEMFARLDMINGEFVKNPDHGEFSDYEFELAEDLSMLPDFIRCRNLGYVKSPKLPMEGVLAAPAIQPPDGPGGPDGPDGSGGTNKKGPKMRERSQLLEHHTNPPVIQSNVVYNCYVALPPEYRAALENGIMVPAVVFYSSASGDSIARDTEVFSKMRNIELGTILRSHLLQNSDLRTCYASSNVDGKNVVMAYNFGECSNRELYQTLDELQDGEVLRVDASSRSEDISVRDVFAGAMTLEYPILSNNQRLR